MIIVAFSKHLMDRLLEFTKQYVPKVSTHIEENIEKQRRIMFLSTEEIDSEGKPLIAEIFDWLVFAMVLYFIISFLNTVVRSYLKENKHK